MSTVYQLFMCITFVGVPRLNFLRNRILNLYPRFQKVMNAYPDYLRYDDAQDNLDNIYRSLDSGGTDVLVLSNEDIKDDTTFKPLLERSPETSVNKGLVLCVASVSRLGQPGRQVVLNLLKTVSPIKEEIRDIIIVCVAHTSLSDKRIKRFKDTLVQELPQDIARYCLNICVINQTQSVSAEVEAIYTKRCTDILLKMYNIVKFYVRNEYIENQSMDVFESESAHTMVKSHLKNTYSMSCVDCRQPTIDILVKHIARILRCAWVNPAAVKHAVPPHVINAIMYHMNLEESLSRGFTKFTRNALLRLNRNANSLLKTLGSPYRRERLFKQHLPHTDKLYNTLLQDSEHILSRIETKITSIQEHISVFRKLMFEIRGYVLQSGFTHLTDTSDLIARGIPINLKKDVLSMKGVYGVGTVYGQLEIHLDISTDDKKFTEQVKEIIQKHRYGYGTRIRHVERKTMVMF